VKVIVKGTVLAPAWKDWLQPQLRD